MAAPDMSFYVTGGTHCGRTHMAAARGVVATKQT